MILDTNALSAFVDGDAAVGDVLRQQAHARIPAALRHGGTTIPANDTWIAALALQHGLPVLSRDTHFDAVPKIRRQRW